MKRIALLTVIGGVVGAFIGMPMGVVGYGSGWGGLVVFGPIGAIMGFLVGTSLKKR